MKTTLKLAFQNVILQGAGTNQEKALVWAVIAVPVFILVATLGHFNTY